MNKTIHKTKTGNRNNKEITKGDKPGVRKPRKETRSHRCKYHQQNKELEERISGAEDTLENTDNSQRKCKKQNVPNPKHPGNSGHNEKTKPKDNRYRRE
jgi:hypothetical protein